MQDIKTKEDFEKAAAQSKDGFLIVILFSAHWSPECQQMLGVIGEIVTDAEYSKTKFYRVEAEELEEITLQYNVTSVPTFLFLLGKSTQHKVQGANPPEFLLKVQELQKRVDTACLGDKTEKVVSLASVDLNDRLKKLINKAPVMIFIKGTPEGPRCGFSRKAIDMLNKCGASFDSFDILTDNDVREGLKKFSNWPSYPQLYINGELIGGVDIMAQMEESGDLTKTLKEAGAGKQSLDERLEKLIKKSKVMVFMKGDPQTPRCGFSRTLIGLLNSTGVPFETFDILTDEEVRQGLKTFSNWPTYPQIYVRGELIGGVDIIQQLNENGELKSTLEGN